MRSVTTFDDGAPPPEIRELDAPEVRVLGCLLEKQQATPEYYPLTLNALVAACNQKSNREPVMELSEDDVAAAVERLRYERLVRELSGSRTSRFEHLLDYRLRLDRGQKAILTLLLLRGPQTTGELKSRSERMHAFSSVSEVENAIEEMSERSRPLVSRVARRSGQKEDRWMHTLAGVLEPVAESEERPAPSVRASGSSRIEALEERVARLEASLLDLQQRLGVD